jgi:hypothetical protein
MQLKDFVSNTLNEIVEGIVAAQEFGRERGALVNPKGLTGLKTSVTYWDSATGTAPEQVEFDVAITAGEGKGTKGGIGVFVGSFALGSQGESESSKSSVSRVKFSIPVHFPRTESLKEFQASSPRLTQSGG